MIKDDLYRRAQKANKKWKRQLRLEKQKERQDKAVKDKIEAKSVSQKWKDFLDKPTGKAIY